MRQLTDALYLWGALGTFGALAYLASLALAGISSRFLAK